MLKHFRSGSKRIRTLWWILTIGTVVTFIGGFIFIFGSGAGDVNRALSDTSVVGKVGSEPIGQTEFANALQTATAQYQSQYGAAPQGRDAAILREQVWNNLVTERALDAEAKRQGIKITDGEIVYAIKNTPPAEVTGSPALQTNGRFDPAKWAQVLGDPNQNWSALEERMRQTLPAQRLEERVIAGLKISEPELQRLFANQYDRVRATVAVLPLDNTPIDSVKLNDAALKTYYDAHKAEFNGPAEVQVDLVTIPRTVGAEEEGIAKSEADAIVAEARGGADFAQLARERSEGPFSAQGGDLGQDIPITRMPAALQPVLDKMPVGGVTDAIREGNTYFIFRLNERKIANGVPAVRLSQIQKPIRPSQESLQKDAELIVKLRAEAASGKLADAAAKRQLVSNNTGWFAQGQFVAPFVQMPQVQTWALTSEKGAVSRAYSNETGWIVAQVVDKRAPGPRPLDAVKDDVRAALTLSLRQAKPMAQGEAIVKAVAGGQTLEQAAAAAGAIVAQTDTFPRSNPDPRLAVAPRAVGVVFGLPLGKTGGPVASPASVLVVRKDLDLPGNPAQYEQLKGQLSSTLLSSRQQRYMRDWVQDAVRRTKVEDMRAVVEEAP